MAIPFAWSMHPSLIVRRAAIVWDLVAARISFCEGAVCEAEAEAPPAAEVDPTSRNSEFLS